MLSAFNDIDNIYKLLGRQSAQIAGRGVGADPI